MEITPAQLDEIATKLLGWKPTRCPIHGTSCPESYYHKPDGTQGHGFLDVESPAAAMLALEAMGRWCGEKDVIRDFHRVRLVLAVRERDNTIGWSCDIFNLRGPEHMGRGDTISQAVFQCAAQLVKRM